MRGLSDWPSARLSKRNHSLTPKLALFCYYKGRQKSLEPQEESLSIKVSVRGGQKVAPRSCTIQPSTRWKPVSVKTYFFRFRRWLLYVNVRASLLDFLNDSFYM